jgi:hypothetical protein
MTSGNVFARLSKIRNVIMLLILAAIVPFAQGESDPSIFQLDKPYFIALRDAKLELINGQSGAMSVICRAECWAVDQSTGDILSAVTTPQGTEFTLQHFQKGKKIAERSASLSLHVYGIQWMATSRTFCIEAVPLNTPNGGVPLFIDFALLWQSKTNGVETAPVVGLGDLIQLPAADGPLFNLQRSGCIAISTMVPSSNVLRGAQRIGQKDASSWLIILKDWQPRVCLSSASPSSSFPIAFSADGRDLLALYTAAGDLTKPQYVDVNLDTAGISPLTWMPTDVDPPVAVAGDLRSAIFVIREADLDSVGIPLSEKVAGLKQQLAAATHSSTADTSRWLVLLMSDDGSVVIVTSYNTPPKIAASRDATGFLVDDGARMFTILGGKINWQLPLH